MGTKATTEGKLRVAAEYYVRYGVKLDALIHAGYSRNYALARGYTIFAGDSMKQYVEEARADLRERNRVTADRIIDEMAKIAFMDSTEIMKLETVEREIDGEPIKYQRATFKDTEELTPEQRAAIKSIKQGPNGLVVEMYSKADMLVKLGDTLGIFKQNINVSGKMETDNPYQGLTTEELKALIASQGRG